MASVSQAPAPQSGLPIYMVPSAPVPGAVLAASGGPGIKSARQNVEQDSALQKAEAAPTIAARQESNVSYGRGAQAEIVTLARTQVEDFANLPQQMRGGAKRQREEENGELATLLKEKHDTRITATTSAVGMETVLRERAAEQAVYKPIKAPVEAPAKLSSSGVNPGNGQLPDGKPPAGPTGMDEFMAAEQGTKTPRVAFHSKGAGASAAANEVPAQQPQAVPLAVARPNAVPEAVANPQAAPIAVARPQAIAAEVAPAVEVAAGMKAAPGMKMGIETPVAAGNASAGNMSNEAWRYAEAAKPTIGQPGVTAELLRQVNTGSSGADGGRGFKAAEPERTKVESPAMSLLSKAANWTGDAVNSQVLKLGEFSTRPAADASFNSVAAPQSTSVSTLAGAQQVRSSTNSMGQMLLTQSTVNPFEVRMQPAPVAVPVAASYAPQARPKAPQPSNTSGGGR